VHSPFESGRISRTQTIPGCGPRQSRLGLDRGTSTALTASSAEVGCRAGPAQALSMHRAVARRRVILVMARCPEKRAMLLGTEL
jgi:hypothetical protein